MGLLGRLFGGGGPSGGVRGTAQVVSATGYHGRGIMQNCSMQLVITADGVPPTAVEFNGIVHNKRWPRPGMVLPVSVDPAEPTRYAILWDEVERSDDRARRSAEQLADAMRDGGGAGGLAGLGGANVNVVNLSGGSLTDAQREKLRMLGLDPDAVAPGPPAAAQPPEEEDDDTLERLERLAALKAEGMLTDEEFAEQKRRILEG